jgi:hypothetical protein
MKLYRWKRIVVIWIIVFACVPLFLNFYAMGESLALNAAYIQGPTPGSVLYTIANWPSMSICLYPTITTTEGEVVPDGAAIFNPFVIIVNAIAWAIPGFIIGLIVSAVKGRRRPAKFS